MSERRVVYSHASMVPNRQYSVTDRHVFDEAVSGIYAVQNVETDRCYVGASKNVAQRWANQKAEISYGYHSTELQTEFNANPENFVFVLLERCAISQLGARELFWMNELQSTSPEWGYNSGKRPYTTKRDHVTRIRIEN